MIRATAHLFSTATLLLFNSSSALTFSEDSLSKEFAKELSCNAVTIDLIRYDITSLQKSDGNYKSTVNGNELEWNYCALLPSEDTFATIKIGDTK